MRLFLLISLLVSYSSFSQVGINTTSPNAQLEIKASNQATPTNTDGIIIPKIDAFPITNPTVAQQGMMVYLTTTSAGKLPGFYFWDTTSWISVSGNNSWALNGNSATNSSNNFIGTIDAQDLEFRTNNTTKLRITQNGRLETINPGRSTFIGGQDAVNSPNLSYANTAIGYGAMSSNTIGSSNTAIGNLALEKNTTGEGNIALGLDALGFNTTGYENTAIGQGAISQNISGFYNVGIGRLVMLNNNYGAYNTAIGNRALDNVTTGNYNIAIGDNTEVPSATANNQMNIGNVIYGSTMSTTALGKIGIGQQNPTEKLDVAGNLKVSGAIMPNNLPGTTGQVLISAGIGVAPTWNNASVLTTNEWHTTGNAGTVAATNFIGTTDNINLIFKRNNIKAGTIGADNTALGVNSFFNNTSGGNNVAIGNRALFTPTDSYYNVAIGDNSLSRTTTGRYNSALGMNSLYNNSTGYGNVAIGYDTLLANTTGIGNTAQGIYSLKTNISGNYNTAIGQQSMENFISGNNNTAIGIQSMALSTGGNFNTAIGSETLRKNTTGLGNVAIGRLTLSENTSGNYNIGIGFQNSMSITSGYQNTIIGHVAGSSLTTGIQNTLIGYTSGNLLTTGSNNIAIGGFSNVTNPVGYNQLSIANVIYGTNLTSTTAGKIGIGIADPSTNLEILNNARISSSNPLFELNGTFAAMPNLATMKIRSAGEVVLRSNTNNATFEDWEIKYGTGTSIMPNDAFYVGRRADPSSVLSNYFLINYLGNTGINNPSPTEKLDIIGNLKINGAIMPNNLPGTTGQVLTSAGAGIAPTWTSSSVQKFSTTGSLGGIYNVSLTEYTVRVFNVIAEIRLPNAVGNQGKIFVIIGSNGIGAKLFSTAGGIIYDDVTNTAPTYINPNERYTVQSDGTDWIVIGR